MLAMQKKALSFCILVEAIMGRDYLLGGHRPIWGDARIWALDLDAAYFASAANNTVHDITTEDWCMSWWVKVNIGAGDIFAAAKRQGGGSGWTTLVQSVNGAFRAIISDGSDAYSMIANTDLRDEQWHHIALVFDRDSVANCKIFLDGSEDGSTNKSGTLANVDSISSTEIMALGSEPDETNEFDGLIRDVKIYYAAGAIWSDAEILYQATHPIDVGASAGTITDNWLLDEGSGLTLNGKVNNLTLSNAAAWSSTQFP